MPDYTKNLRRGVKGLRIGVPDSFFFDSLDPEVEAGVRSAIGVLESLGATVAPVKLPQIQEIRNFWDRIALKYIINPLSLKETREIIDFRLRQAGYQKTSPLFTDAAVDVIFQRTEGCPRRIMMLCHNALESLIIKNKPVVEAETVRELISEEARIVDAKS